MTRDDIIRMAHESHIDVYGLGKDYTKFADALERFAALVAVQVEAPWQNRYLKLVDLMQIREGQPNKPCCLAEREKFEKLIDELTNKSLHVQLNAVAAEREACANVCEILAWNQDSTWKAATIDCAAAIRARGQE